MTSDDSKLRSRLTDVIDRLNEQDLAIKQLRDRDASLGKFHKQVAAAWQVFVGSASGCELNEKFSAQESEPGVLAQGPAYELSCAEVPTEQTVVKEDMDKIASLERKMEALAASQEEKLNAIMERIVVSVEAVVTQALQRVEVRLESLEMRLKQVQTQADTRDEQCNACESTGPLPEEGGKEMRTPSAEPSIPLGLLFPGQGSQYVKMMTGVKDLPAVKAMLEKAKSILGWDVLEVCLNGPESRLEQTRFCQPAMFIAGMAGVEKLRQDRRKAVERFQVTAGLSLGEYTALCVAGVFSFEDGLKLVDVRGKAMEEAGKTCKQAMCSICGLNKPLLEELCEQAQAEAGSSSVCQIANELFPKGFSCSGTELAIRLLIRKSDKAGALQAKLLKTGVACHSSLMAPVKEKLGAALDEMLPKMNPPRHTVYMNATAEPLRPGTDPKEVVELLKRSLTSPVKWEPSVRAMIKSGVIEFYEVGPMKQIKAMMKRIDSRFWGNTGNVEV